MVYEALHAGRDDVEAYLEQVGPGLEPRAGLLPGPRTAEPPDPRHGPPGGRPGRVAGGVQARDAPAAGLHAPARRGPVAEPAADDRRRPGRKRLPLLDH